MYVLSFVNNALKIYTIVDFLSENGFPTDAMRGPFRAKHISMIVCLSRIWQRGVGVVVITSYRKTAKLCWKRAHWLILNIIGEKIKGKMYKLSIIINSKSYLLEQQLSYLFFLYPNWYTFLDHFLLMTPGDNPWVEKQDPMYHLRDES